MEPAAELKKIVLDIYEALTKGHAEPIEELISREDGLVLIGTDPEEWWVDAETFRGVLRKQIQEMGDGIALVAGELTAYREGTVGWVADRPTLHMPDGSKVPLRYTFAFHQEDGQWKVVQWHLSIGVPNEAALGRTLTA